MNTTPLPRPLVTLVADTVALVSPRPRAAPGVHVRRASPKRRRELHAAQVGAAQEQYAITKRIAAEVVYQVAGLPVSESTAAAPTGSELLVEVVFAGVRSGRLTVGFSRGLTRQVGAAMAAMVDLDGRPLNPVEAAKELTSALAHAVLGAIFWRAGSPTCADGAGHYATAIRRTGQCPGGGRRFSGD